MQDPLYGRTSDQSDQMTIAAPGLSFDLVSQWSLAHFECFALLRELATCMAASLGPVSCAATTPDLHVVRPATAFTKLPSKLSVGKWVSSTPDTVPSWGRAFQKALEAELSKAPGGLVRVTSDAPTRLSGTISLTVDDVPTPPVTMTCVKYDAEAGTLHFPCVYLRRRLSATVAVTVNSLNEPLVLTTTRTSHDYVPIERFLPEQNAPGIDHSVVCQELVNEAAAKLAKNFAPFIDTFSKPALDCGAQADACQKAWQALSSCDYALAQRSFENVNLQLASQPGPVRAAGYWGLGVTLELAGRIEESKTTLLAGFVLDPSQSVFAAELGKLGQEGKSAGLVRKQGAGGLSACAK